MIEKQIQSRINIVEGWIAECKDEKSLPALIQRLLEEQVRRDMERERL